jgi:hypothetical protein
MGKMMKQFGRTMRIVMGLAVAAAVLSSIPAQAAGSNVVNHAFVPAVGWFTPDFSELVSAEVVSTTNGYMLSYIVVDFGGGFSASGFGSIPASTVTVSGGSINGGNVTVALNVNTCDVTGFTTSYGPCGTFNLTWVEVPAAGSFATRGDTQQTLPGGGKVVTNGEQEIFNAVTTGTALGFDAPTPTGGVLIKETNVTVTVTGP